MQYSKKYFSRRQKLLLGILCSVWTNFVRKLMTFQQMIKYLGKKLEQSQGSVRFHTDNYSLLGRPHGFSVSFGTSSCFRQKLISTIYLTDQNLK